MTAGRSGRRARTAAAVAVLSEGHGLHDRRPLHRDERRRHLGVVHDFRPTTLGAGGCLNPVIVWGNGTTNTPSSYTALFNHLATQGFIVAAADTSNAGSGKEMLALPLRTCIDQNTASGSPYKGHIDVITSRLRATRKAAPVVSRPAKTLASR